MHNPTRVLQVFASLDRGGAEGMIMSAYRSIDKTKVQFDFVVNENVKEYAHEEEILSLGGRIFYMPRYSIFNYLKYKKAWQNLLKEHPEWKIIHGHHTSPAYIYLNVAKRFQRVTVAHSHTAGSERTIKSYLKYAMRFTLRHISDYLFACSNKAARWMFGNNQKVKVVFNAIDAKKYVYNKVIAENMRKKLNVENKFVVGHIGNFSKAKNYPFILDVFEFVLKQNDNALLMLVGKKENNPEIEKKVVEMGLKDKVIFTGVRSDIPELLQAMDVFLFPSLFEGLGIVLIESQATGLKCFTSTAVPKEAKITEHLEFLELNKGANFWAEKIIVYKNGYERKNTYDDILKSGYDIAENAKWLQDFYINTDLESK